MIMAPSGVREAGFITNGQPTATAGAILCAAKLSGTLNDEMMPSLVATLTEAEKALASADSLIAPDSDASIELKRLLFELADAAKAIRRLAEQLEEHPESLIHGKKEAGQ